MKILRIIVDKMLVASADVTKPNKALTDNNRISTATTKGALVTSLSTVTTTPKA